MTIHSRIADVAKGHTSFRSPSAAGGVSYAVVDGAGWTDIEGS